MKTPLPYTEIISAALPSSLISLLEERDQLTDDVLHSRHRRPPDHRATEFLGAEKHLPETEELEISWRGLPSTIQAYANRFPLFLFCSRPPPARPVCITWPRPNTIYSFQIGDRRRLRRLNMPP